MPAYANNGSLVIMAVTKAVIAVLLVATVCVCVVLGREMPDGVVKVVILVLAAYFGFSAKVYHESEKNRTEVDARLARAVERMREAGRDDVSWRMDRD